MAMNPFAAAWLEAASDLGLRVVHPFSFTSTDGKAATTVGVFLPDFGFAGMLLTCRFDSDEVHEIADSSDFGRSSLNPHHYEPYLRDTYIEALNDWGWCGKGTPPDFFNSSPS